MKLHDFETGNLNELTFQDVLGTRAADPPRFEEIFQRSKAKISDCSSQIVASTSKHSEDAEKLERQDLELALNLASDFLPQFCRSEGSDLTGEQTERLQTLLGKSAHWNRVLPALSWNSLPHLDSQAHIHLATALDELVQYANRLHASNAVREKSRELASNSAAAFIGFCEAEGHRIGKADTQELTDCLESYFQGLSDALRLGSRREVALHHSLLWSELILPRYECDFLQWTFLLACLEQALYQEAGSEVTREITPYLDDISKATVNLNIIGLFRRNLPTLQAELLSRKDLPFLPFEWPNLIRLILGELICAESHRSGVSLVRARIFAAEEALGGAEPDKLRTFISALINHCRDLVERNWLDLLEDALRASAASLEASLRWTQLSPHRERVVARATNNLHEALDVFDSVELLETDVKLILRQAFICTETTPTVTVAKEEFRKWFAYHFAIPFTEQWSQATPVVRAVLTSARQDQEFPLFSTESSEAEVLGTLERVATAASDRLHELKNSELAVQTGAPVTGEQWRALVYRSTADDILVSGEKAAVTTLEWCLRGAWVGLDRLSDKSFRVSLERLTDELESPHLKEILARFTEMFPRLALSVGLWKKSEEIATRTAAIVYREMSDYRELTNGKTGEAKCARDSSFALRRLALSLAPSVADPAEQFGVSWRSLVDRYVHNRPAGLFRTTSAALVKTVSEHFDPAASELVEEILVPVYDQADTARKVETTHQVVAWKGAWGDSPLPGLRGFLSEHSATALEYSRRFTGSQGSFSLDEDSLEMFRDILEDGYPAFSKLGLLSTAACSRWSRHCDGRDSHSWALERYLISLLYQAGDQENTPVTEKLKLIDYLQAWIEFNRRYRVGLELKQRSTSLAQLMGKNHPELENPQNFISELAHILGATPPLTARFELVRLAFALCGQGAVDASGWGQLHQTVTENATKLLGPVSAAEFQSVLEEWNSLTAHLQSWSAALKLYEGSEDPIFSPVPEEEIQWRCILNWCLARELFQPEEQEHIDYLILSSFEVATDYDFEDRLLKAVEFLSLGERTAEVNSNAKKLLEKSKMFDDLDDLEEDLAEVDTLNDEGPLSPTEGAQTTELLTRILRRAQLPLSPASRWGISPAVRLFCPQWVPQNVDEQGVSKLKDTLLAGTAEHSADKVCVKHFIERMAEQLSSLPALVKIWDHDWQLGGTFWQDALGGKKCRRDGHWTARRVAVEDWSKTGSTYNWYRREIVPHVGQHRTEEYIHMMCDLAGQLCGHAHRTDSLSQTALRFRDKVLDALLQGSSENEPTVRLITHNPSRKRRGFPSLFQASQVAEQSAYSLQPALDYVTQFTDYPDQKWAESVLSVLRHGHREYQQTLFVGPESLAQWYHLLSEHEEAGLALERFLVGLVYEVDKDCEGVLDALARIDYLQAHIDAVRQVALGAALARKSDALNEAWERADAGTPRLLHAWARAALARPKSLALYDMVRSWISSEGLDAVKDSSEWRELWKSFLREPLSKLEHQQQLTAQTFVRSFNHLNEQASFFGCLAGQTQHPLFEAARSLLSLTVLHEAEPDLARLARARVVHEASKGDVDGFRDHLRKVCDYLTEILIDHELTGIDEEASRCADVYQTILSWGELESTLGDKAPKIGERLPLLEASMHDSHVRLLRTLSYRFLPERASTTWGFPRELRAVPQDLLSVLEESEREDFDKWVGAWATILGRNGLSKDDFTASANRLRHLLDWRKDMEAAWGVQWQMDTRRHGGSCERDLGWLARRLVAEGWFGQGDSRVVTSWYIREIIPFTGDVDPKAYAKFIKSVSSKISSEVVFPESIRELAGNFRRRIETAAKGQTEKAAFRESLILGLDFDDTTLEKSQGFFSRLADSFEQLVSGR